MSQQSSPFFRLPRELRDEIYRYALLEPGGYHYDPISGKLRTEQGSAINLSLCYMCRQVATETFSMPLQEITLRFSSYPDASATAKKFKDLRKRSVFAVKRMLAWAADCVTAEHLDILQSAFPHHEGIRFLRSKNAAYRKCELETRGITGCYNAPEHVTVQAIHDLLAVIGTDPRFHSLSAKEYDPKLRNGQPPPNRNDYRIRDDEEDHIPRYAPHSQRRVIEWNPQPWDISDPADLDEMDKLMYQPEWNIDITQRVCPKTQYYYSGTASAIRFLKGIRPETRLSIRKIEIDERHLSVGKMDSHAHGLIPYCRENPKLKVEIRIDIWRVVMLKGLSPGRWTLSVSSVLSRVARWLRESSLLSQQGMPRGQCTLFFHGGESGLTQQLWDVIKRAAALDDAIIHLPNSLPLEAQHNRLLATVPPDLGDLVKQVVEGSLPIRFDAMVGGLWDLEQAASELKYSGAWHYDLRNVIGFLGFERHEDTWELIWEEHYIYP
ncbi:hypothetical protein P171DRAFT_504383 [Karstenula rhodostoma CBS 690.94]|uniref:Uncharacterized protein n=1 Tax=Karstenula rhodostoma CBS 690.94 TaxID=1392251 RepID=A0A9P4P998_9PLEO|nr:hypothetical protein P171DRAFT_504383 [Karstenula rhodostoma CBS 690.94]